MKKVITAVMLLMVFSISASAQREENSFQNGTNVVNLGLGVGNVYWGAGYGASGLPFSLDASFEHGITEKLGIGYIGIGGELSYASTKYTHDGYVYWTSTGLMLAARASYHFAIPGDLGQKLDPYAGVLIGGVITSNSYANSYVGTAKGSGIAAGAYAGVHYYFSPHFGVYGELGVKPFSILTAGVSFKF